MGRAVAQAVSRWFPTAAARVRVRATCLSAKSHSFKFQKWVMFIETCIRIWIIYPEEGGIIFIPNVGVYIYEIIIIIYLTATGV
jgi:hypothetical protein